VLPRFGCVSHYHDAFCRWHRYSPENTYDLRTKSVEEESTIERRAEAGKARVVKLGLFGAAGMAVWAVSAGFSMAKTPQFGGKDLQFGDRRDNNL
jgi:hypothetical protein